MKKTTKKRSGARISIYLTDEQHRVLKDSQIHHVVRSGKLPTFSVMVGSLIDRHGAELKLLDFSRPFLEREKAFAEELIGLCDILEENDARGKDSFERIHYHVKSIAEGALRHQERVEQHRQRMMKEMDMQNTGPWKVHDEIRERFEDVHVKATKLLNKLEKKRE